MKKTLGFRRTPWEPDTARSRDIFLGCDPHTETLLVPCWIRLQGHWLVDAQTATQEDVRHFMWEGLRAFRREAKAWGLSESRVNEMIQAAFGPFHDAAADIYGTLRAARAEQPKRVKWFARHPGDCIWVARELERPIIACVDQPAVEDYQTVALIEEEPKNKPVPEDLFVACDEDRPVPVTVRFRKQKPLLNPDREVLESFEP
jgi:hypothetical protein